MLYLGKMLESYKILHLFNVWVYPGSCKKHSYTDQGTCIGSKVQSYTLLFSIGLHIGKQGTWMWWHGAEQQPDLETLIEVKINSCNVSTWHHERQVDKPVGKSSRGTCTETISETNQNAVPYSLLNSAKISKMYQLGQWVTCIIITYSEHPWIQAYHCPSSVSVFQVWL